MRVAVVNLTRVGASGGYLTYLREMVPLLSADPRVQRLDVLLPDTVAAKLDVDFPVSTWPASARTIGFLEAQVRVRELDADVVFVPTARWAAFGMPTVTMVRNMEPLLYPFAANSLPDMLANLARRAAAKRSVRRADRIIAVSRFVTDFLVSRWRVPQWRIGTVPHGVRESPAATMPPSLGALGPFLFTAGSIRPARGLEDAVAAVRTLHERGLDLPLVIAAAAAGENIGYARRLRKLAGADADSFLRWAGELSGAEMAWCFRHCAAFIMTSRVEACPNTVLEAMVNGCLSISCDAPPMPEFFADGAIYYRTGDATDLAAVLNDWLARESGKTELVRRRAREIAAKYSWEWTAKSTVDELELAWQGRGRDRRRPAAGSTHY